MLSPWREGVRTWLTIVVIVQTSTFFSSEVILQETNSHWDYVKGTATQIMSVQAIYFAKSAKDMLKYQDAMVREVVGTLISNL